MRAIVAVRPGEGTGSVNQSDDDVVLGGAGDDTLMAHDGNDVLFGRGGADRLEGGNGGDTLVGGEGDRSFGAAPRRRRHGLTGDR
ncbi:MAG: hypothetical protein ACE367_16970 [Acidimicrobiales bacterium]